jgi:hypothetical protein
VPKEEAPQYLLAVLLLRGEHFRRHSRQRWNQQRQLHFFPYRLQNEFMQSFIAPPSQRSRSVASAAALSD